MKIGLKIWSINKEAFPKLREFYSKGLIQYVEMLIVPGSFDKEALSPLIGIPMLFHAPEHQYNFRINCKDKAFTEASSTIRQFIRHFDEQRIIIHPGYNKAGESFGVDDVIKNIKTLRGVEPIIENVPDKAVVGGLTLIASTPEDIKKILLQTRAKFCLDFGHAVASANFHKQEPLECISAYLALNPLMFHVSDGNFSSSVDSHLDLGAGNYPLKDMLGLVDNDSMITLETPKKDFLNLHEDMANLMRLYRILKKRA